MNEVSQDKKSSILLIQTHIACILLSCFCLAARLCPTLCDPMAVALQASLSMGCPRPVLEWVAISLSSGSA